MLTEYDEHEKKIKSRGTDPFIHHLRPKHNEYNERIQYEGLADNLYYHLL